ncbi:MAG: bacterial transcriptional activator domain-containing protein [bacterium]|nr:bacterial transcriptional activator domain-containing protein [bacterium]
MIHQVVTRVSLDSFRERSRGKKVILLYPWTNYRNLFLTHFLASASEGLLYYRIPTNQASLSTWVADLINELDSALGGFGSKTRSVLEWSTAEGLGAALAEDLVTYRKTRARGESQLTLFIDEFDRVPHDSNFDTFIHALVNALPADVQLVVSSRLLNHQPWYDMVASGTAVVLGTEHRKNDVMFTVEEKPKPQLEIYALGRGHALVNGQEIANWDGALPRNLFFYFIDNPLVTRDDIFSTFWPNLTIKEATNVFHVTKRKISERITMKVEENGNYELTQYASGFYMPSDKVVRHYDAGDFQEAVERAQITHDDREAEVLYRRAVDLYKAPFLETIHMPWVDARREHLRQLYAHALVGMGRIHQRRGENHEALGYFVRTLKESPEREDIHREVISLYIQFGAYDDARNQYNHLKQILDEKFGLPPSPDTDTLLAGLNGH